jgi:hypothetical protein
MPNAAARIYNGLLASNASADTTRLYATGGAPRMRLVHSAREVISVLPEITRSDTELERVFNELFERWHSDTMKYSDPNEITGHLSYYQIVALGEEVLPLLLRELKRGTGFLFLALRAITRQNPVPPEHMGNRKQMAEDWLQWARDHGYSQA